jgi:phenylpropionate dioxygenase-like ring-hydroxylating dioxygenase large terminal subunit
MAHETRGNEMENSTTSNSATSKLLSPYSRPLIRNAWYCAAWADELGETLLARRILDWPILLYRTESGDPTALLDICPHKLAPMHLGRREGDNVVCGYHGLTFNQHGTCVRNPQGNQIIPPQAKLRSFPVVERFEVIWIWMGAPELAGPSQIADFSDIGAPDRKTVRGGHRVESNYMLMVENLMDLGHALFLHGQSAGTANVELAESKVFQENGAVMDQRLYRGIAAPFTFASYVNRHDEKVDFWTDITWRAPSLIQNYAGVSPPGQARDPASAIFQVGSHMLTPETQHTTHYFYAHSRNYALEDPEADAVYKTWQRKALKEEDSLMAEAIERNVPDASAMGVDMVMLSTDVSGFRVNRILDELAAAEQ